MSSTRRWRRPGERRAVTAGGAVPRARAGPARRRPAQRRPARPGPARQASPARRRGGPRLRPVRHSRYLKPPAPESAKRRSRPAGPSPRPNTDGTTGTARRRPGPAMSLARQGRGRGVSPGRIPPEGPCMSLTIGIDVGGTKVAAGAVDDQGRIVEKLRRSTPSASPELTAAVIAEAAAELLSRHEASAVGVGAAGFVNEAAGTVAFAPNLAWRDEPLRARVEGMIGVPVVVENDGNASAWAEARFGAARGHAHVVFISVGTGIGAGFVLDGRLYRGQWGMAGEPGHFRVVPDGRLCGCGNRGCWEQYASGNALTTEARDLARRSPSGAARLLQLAGGNPDAIGGAQITQAATEGDPAALRCFGIVGGWLGQGMADLAAILDPGCFVIGGGVSEAGELLIGPARAAFEKGVTGGHYRPHVHITRAALGPDAGIVGAADLARQA